MTRCDQTPAWAALQAHYDATGKGFDLRDAFASDPQRFAAFSQDAPHIFADLSKNLIDRPTEALLMQLAEQCGLKARRTAMFAGECVNTTEHRAAMHFLLRHPLVVADSTASDAIKNRANSSRTVHKTLAAMLSYAERIRRDDRITDIVNIGIGGSDLGPQMAVLALAEFAVKGPGAKRFHFISNVDGQALAAVLAQVKPQNTLFFDCV